MMIGHSQTAPHSTYVHDARREPLAPGEGEALAVELVHDVDGDAHDEGAEELAHHEVEPFFSMGGWGFVVKEKCWDLEW